MTVPRYLKKVMQKAEKGIARFPEVSTRFSPGLSDSTEHRQVMHFPPTGDGGDFDFARVEAARENHEQDR